MRLDLSIALALLVGASLPVGTLRAQDEPEGAESDELRAIRLAEREIFADLQPRIELTPELPHPVRLGVPPAAISSEAEPAMSRITEARPRDLSFLEGLTLPDLPVRWDERVIRYLEYFRDDPRGHEIARSWLRRSQRYAAAIRTALRQEGLPGDLLYVAMIESGFDPRARSHRGAVGMWQFVSRTGDEYGLTRNRWVDMRMDPVAASHAGARYLAALHRRLGTWELALAAYNMGYGALLRSIRKYDTNDYWELSHLEAGLPFETSLYVSKIMALAVLDANPDRFGFGELTREDEIAFEDVEVPGGTRLTSIARAAGTTVEALRVLNPALLRDRTPPGMDGFVVHVPRGATPQMAERWSRIGRGEPPEAQYVVRFGEDAAEVATRFRITERALRELNDMDDAEHLNVGTVLVVPAVAPRPDSLAETPVVAVPPGTFSYPDRQRVFYRAHRRDELTAIAHFFAVSVDEIRRWNAVDPHARLQDGMFLQLFVPTRVDLARAIIYRPEQVTVLEIGSEAFHAHHLAQDGRVRFRYQIRAGDTLSGLARRFDLSTGSIARINQIPRSATLRLGQSLIIYTSEDRMPRGAEAIDGEEAETESDSVTESESESDSESESESESETESESESDLDAQVDVD